MNKAAHKFDPSIFREYDIRGVYGKTLHDEDAYWIGRAYAAMLPENARICVAYDGRHSSPALAARLIEGLTDSGVNVINLGLGPTPMAYFGVFHLQTDGAIMVTASHNPPADNGFKFMLGKDAMFGEQIQSLAALAHRSQVISHKGKEKNIDIKTKYLERVSYDLKPMTYDLKIAYDPANGAMGEMIESIASSISSNNLKINTKVDGNFPAHPADPTKLENNQQLIDLVLQNNCDIGFGFDGDGDRLGIIDDKGRMLAGDQILAILARDVLAEKPQATIIADVKSSRLFEQEITRLGGKPMLWKTGHSLIKAKMKELNAPLAGEMSAHIFFADNNGYDDALYAAVRFLNVMQSSGLKASELLDALPQMHSSPELRLACPEERKFAIIEEIKSSLILDNSSFSDIDGVRVNEENGWWLMRASNTGAEMVARCEGNTEAELERQMDRLSILLAKYELTI